MALGVPPFDKDGFSTTKLRGFEWDDPSATLLVAPRKEVIDTYGEPLFFLCDNFTCLLNKTNKFSIGAFRSLEGFHLSSDIRFSAKTARLDQEERLKSGFEFVRRVVSGMIEN